MFFESLHNLFGFGHSLYHLVDLCQGLGRGSFYVSGRQFQTGLLYHGAQQSCCGRGVISLYQIVGNRGDDAESFDPGLSQGIL